jgi:hypothetical protein
MWGGVAALAAVDAAWGAASGLGVAIRTLLPSAAACCAMMAVAWAYTTLRPRPEISGLASSGAAFVAYTLAVVFLSYLVTGLGLPLIDDRLVAADRAIGLDWRRAYDWVAGHRPAALALSAAYLSPIPQFVALLMILNARREAARVRELVLLFVATSLATVLLSGPFPAAGAFAAYGVHQDEPYLAQFAALRAGTMRAVDYADLQGLVQFPSFHMALAVSLAWAWRGMGRATPPLVALNALMAAATPFCGGHHFADLWGGAAVAAAAVAALRLRGGRAADDRRDVDEAAGGGGPGGEGVPLHLDGGPVLGLEVDGAEPGRHRRDDVRPQGVADDP